jgi:hypothetical protein
VLCAGLAVPLAAYSQPSGIGSKAAMPQSDRKLDANLLRLTASAPLDAPFVSIRAAVTADLVAFLRTRGATELTEFRDHDTINARVPVDALAEVARRADVHSVGPREEPMFHRAVLSPEQEQARRGKFFAAMAKTGTGAWQGVVAHKADKAHQSGITGAGVKVCVFSDGVDSLAARQASGDLPANVTVLAGQRGSGDGGTAMLEIINDMAPNATLAFATANGGPEQFAANIAAMTATMGCNVNVDNVTYPSESAFQDGPIAKAVSRRRGTWVTAAGNAGNTVSNSAASFEADFVASSQPVPTAIAGVDGPGASAHSFGATNYTTVASPTSLITLKWSDPLGKASNDYDLFVTDSTATTILASGVMGQMGSQDPYESVQCPNCVFPVGARVYVVKFAGVARMLRLQTHGGRLAHSSRGTTFGHNALEYVVTAGAVDLAYASGGLFTGGTTTVVQPYSSDGPRRMYFHEDGTPIEPDGIGGMQRSRDISKVDTVAGDCGTTTTPGYSTFCGTAAAAATAAGIIALAASIKSPPLSNYISAGLGLDIGTPGADPESGFGIMMADTVIFNYSVGENLRTRLAFSPSSITPGETSVVAVITVTNPNAIPLINANFATAYPVPEVRNASRPDPRVMGPGCSASLVAAPGGSTFSVSGATIPALSTCTFTVTITVTATSVGTFTISVPKVSLPLIDFYGASADLSVTAPFATNVALSSEGAVATASSSFGSGFPVAAVNNNERRGANWGSGGGWADGTIDSYPDWVQIAFNGRKSIDRVAVYTLQDNYTSPVEPGNTLTFSQYGVTDFVVEGWTGSSWTTLGTVSGNNLVKRTVTFAPFVTDRIRVQVTNARAAVARITEIEAWGVPAERGTNVALASNGATATASSSYGPGFPVRAVIDNERAGRNWTAGGGWADATIDAYPDWAQVSFSGMKSIDRVVVYTLQDNYTAPVEPDDTMTFSAYGIVDFTVQGWDGSSWVVLGTVSGNDRVKRTVTFAAFTTDRIRVVVANARTYLSRITEIEAWGVPIASPMDSLGKFPLFQVTASSTFGSGFPVRAMTDGDRRGVNWGAGGGWADATVDNYPDYVTFTFGNFYYVDRVVLYTVQDDYANPVEPGDDLTFHDYGVTDFSIERYNVGFGFWHEVARVTGNNRVKRVVELPSISSRDLRIVINNARGGLSRITEIEVYGHSF